MAKMSVSGSSAGADVSTLFEKPSWGSRPAAASVSARTGIAPPFATIAARLVAAPAATIAMPGRRRLTSRATSTATVEPT
jgi:hypothetical protein